MNRLLLLRLSLQALFLLAFSLLAGCSSSSHSEPAHYNLVFQAHPQINDGAPLKVRVMLLKSDADFMSADFYSLQNNAPTLLGGNLINSEQFFLMPGQLNKVLSGQSTSEARYIGILAEYQSLDGKKWRLSLPLPVPNDSSFYKFWQGSTDELKADIIADISGLRTVKQ
ncbi:Type VI secretion lipoprotein/VasD [Erwinia typographi]|uniref:Type VI secretion lipoprotein/VasD n=1 Tax=Erwinia typographi TaxID=371042 RepID=A0A0A3Z8N5_9GAMM|nr:type VI secretion system lipoprotein TssJ [Erwinia typographi]KGT95225.1 Type VI secretion lipoprotein/VasD [Erwinia typographi]